MGTEELEDVWVDVVVRLVVFEVVEDFDCVVEPLFDVVIDGSVVESVVDSIVVD